MDVKGATLQGDITGSLALTVRSRPGSWLRPMPIMGGLCSSFQRALQHFHLQLQKLITAHNGYFSRYLDYRDGISKNLTKG